LPDAFDVQVSRTVTDTCLVNFESRQYEVPARYGAFSMLSRVDRAWLNADNDMRRNIQQVVFPDGLIYLGDGKFRTPVTSLAFNILELVEAPESNSAPRNEFEHRKRQVNKPEQNRFLFFRKNLVAPVIS
jgi:hypothetical protein